MAGRGPAPKKNRTRPNDTARRAAEFERVSADGEVRGPELPIGFDWPQRTVEWWDTWRVCAQAATFTDSDWQFLLDTAMLHAELWSGNAAVASELRLRVAKFGATPEDRLRLRLEVESAAEAAPKAAKRNGAEARRGRLMAVVSESP